MTFTEITFEYCQGKVFVCKPKIEELEIEGTLVLVNSQMYSLPVDRLWCENFNSGAKE